MPIILLIIAIFTAAVLAAFRFAFVRSRRPGMWDEPPESIEAHARLTEQALTLRHFRWEMRAGSLTLRARYFPGKRDAAVVLIHGYRGESMHDHARNVLFYASQEYHILAPDLRAHGESDGRIIGFGLHDSLDIAAWCRMLRRRIGVEKIILHGVSMGAAAAILTAARFPVSAVIADSAFTSARQILDRVVSEILHIARVPVYAAMLGFAKIMGLDMSRCAPVRDIKNVRAPMLLIHGTADKFVPSAMSESLHHAAPSSRLLLIDGARHAESNEAAPDEYYQAVSEFLAASGV